MSRVGLLVLLKEDGWFLKGAYLFKQLVLKSSCKGLPNIMCILLSLGQRQVSKSKMLDGEVAEG